MALNPSAADIEHPSTAAGNILKCIRQFASVILPCFQRTTFPFQIISISTVINTKLNLFCSLGERKETRFIILLK